MSDQQIIDSEHESREDRIARLENALWRASEEKLDIIEKVLDL